MGTNILYYFFFCLLSYVVSYWISCSCSNIDSNIQADARTMMKEWIKSLVNKVARIGWQNIPDMRLGVSYTKNGLYDINQDIVYDGYTRLNDAWYSVL